MARYLLFLIVSLFFTAACEGPVGPAGEAGPPGRDGINGVDGKDGKDGNANVRVFDITLRANDFVNWGPWDLAVYDAPLITQDVITRGAVAGYYSVTNGNVWHPLGSSGVISVGYAVGEVSIILERWRDGTSRVPLYDGDICRFVVIYPPEPALLDKVDQNDYEAVLEAVTVNS